MPKLYPLEPLDTQGQDPGSLPLFELQTSCMGRPPTVFTVGRGARCKPSAKPIRESRANVDYLSHFTISKVWTHSSIGGPLPFGVRRCNGRNQSPGHQNVRGPVNNDPTGQPGCYDRTKGDFHCCSNRYRPARLPVAKEWHGHQRRDLLFLHDSGHNGFRRSRAVLGGR